MITDTMDALASAITDALIADGIKRPVTTDPKNVASLPSVLVEVPTITGVDRTMCGYHATCPVYVIGTSGTVDATRAIAPLLKSILGAVNWTNAQPVAFTPQNPAASADPVLAYRIETEVHISWS